MLNTGFHILGGNMPFLGFKIYLRPFAMAHLSGARESVKRKKHRAVHGMTKASILLRFYN